MPFGCEANRFPLIFVALIFSGAVSLCCALQAQAKEARMGSSLGFLSGATTKKYVADKEVC
jgi:hypothetical protein